MYTLPVISLRRTRYSIPKSFLRLALSLSLILLAATRGAAQYGGGGGGTSGGSGTPGYTPPSGGYSLLATMFRNFRLTARRHFFGR